MKLHKILVVDDDTNICELHRLYLEKESYLVEIAHNGASAIELFESKGDFDLILLDVMMPGLDGWQVCREIRKKSETPIIMVTAKDETFDKVLGLELGADDYLAKPFDTKELLARVKAVLRRTSIVSPEKPSSSEVTFDNFSINMSRYQLKLNNEAVDIPPKELELLFQLSSNPNDVFTRDQLLDAVWGFEYFGDSRTVDVHIKRIREKLENISPEWSLKTVWGVGYKFETNN